MTLFLSILSSGVNKFIIHSRKCFLNGLSPKQNRDIPPLQYDVVHRLVRDFPDLNFILNGGIGTISQAQQHLSEYDGLPPVNGVMIGRAVWNDPYILSNADSIMYNQPDPCLTRRQVMDRYLEHCDKMQDGSGPKKIYRGKTTTISPSVLVKAVQNAFVGCNGNTRYRNSLNEAYLAVKRNNEQAFARDIVS